MGLFNVSDDFFLREILNIFRDFVYSIIFVSSHVFSDCFFLMFLKASVSWRLMFLSSSASISNWWIVISWLLTVPFSTTNLNFKPSMFFFCRWFHGCLTCISWRKIIQIYINQNTSHHKGKSPTIFFNYTSQIIIATFLTATFSEN